MNVCVSFNNALSSYDYIPSVAHGWNMRLEHCRKDTDRGQTVPYLQPPFHVDLPGIEQAAASDWRHVNHTEWTSQLNIRSIPVIVRTKAYVSGLSIAATEDPYTTKFFTVCLLCLLCVVQVATSETSWSLLQRRPTVCARPLTRGLETSNEAA
jgi:hypothetical protein